MMEQKKNTPNLSALQPTYLQILSLAKRKNPDDITLLKLFIQFENELRLICSSQTSDKDTFDTVIQQLYQEHQSRFNETVMLNLAAFAGKMQAFATATIFETLTASCSYVAAASTRAQSLVADFAGANGTESERWASYQTKLDTNYDTTELEANFLTDFSDSVPLEITSIAEGLHSQLTSNLGSVLAQYEENHGSLTQTCNSVLIKVKMHLADAITCSQQAERLYKNSNLIDGKQKLLEAKQAINNASNSLIDPAQSEPEPMSTETYNKTSESEIELLNTIKNKLISATKKIEPIIEMEIQPATKTKLKTAAELKAENAQKTFNQNKIQLDSFIRIIGVKKPTNQSVPAQTAAEPKETQSFVRRWLIGGLFGKPNNGKTAKSAPPSREIVEKQTNKKQEAAGKSNWTNFFFSCFGKSTKKDKNTNPASNFTSS